LREAFGAELVELEEDYWQLQFGFAASTDVFLQELPGYPDRVHGIALHRPCPDMRLFQAIWKLLGVAGTIFYYPGGPAPLARDLLAGESMPAELLRSLGQPTLVDGAVAISRVVVLP
jgi:hypothetical protein